MPILRDVEDFIFLLDIIKAFSSLYSNENILLKTGLVGF
jgi:hypothetical protein